jgi:hypothetical protein
MSVRDSLLENLAGDLEYHPRRAALYLAIAAAAICFWIFSSSEAKFTYRPLVFGLGGLALLVKGILLLRKSSEGIGLSEKDISNLAGSYKRKSLPPVPSQAAQILQDFGTGPLLLWPLLKLGSNAANAENSPVPLQILVTGGILFALGWLVRRLTSPPQL